MNSCGPFAFETVRDDAAMLHHLNESIGWVSTPLEHRFWCSNEFPQGQTLDSFDGIAKPMEVYLLKNGNEVVSYFELHHNHFGWILARHIVKPEHRRQGFAAALMDHSIQRLFQYSNTATLFQDEENTAAASLHARFGFQEIGRFEEHKLICLRLHQAEYMAAKELWPTGVKLDC